MDGEVNFLLLCLIAVGVLLSILPALAMYVLLARPWLRAAANGAPVSLFSILGMRMRGNPPILLIDAYIALRRSGVNASIVDVELAYIEHRTRVRTHDDLVELTKSAVANHEVAR